MWTRRWLEICAQWRHCSSMLQRTEGKLATVTVVNLKANISFALIPVQLLYFFPCAVVCHHGIHTLCLSFQLGAVRKKAPMLVNCSASTVREPESANQNFWPVRNSSDRPTAVWGGIIGPHSPCTLHGKRHPTKLKFCQTIKWVMWLNNQVKNGLKSHSVRPA